MVLLPGMRLAKSHGAAGKGTRSRSTGGHRMSSAPRLIEVRKNVLKQNDIVARALRTRFRQAGVFAISVVSSPGSGKTAFLEKLLTAFHCSYKVAALVG